LTKTAVSGDAQVEFIISETGDVAEAHVVTATNPLFGQAAVEAILQWKFLPGVRDGKPVNTRIRQTLHFDLSIDEKPNPAAQPTPPKGG